MTETTTKQNKKSGARRIVESALMVAFATALSMVKVLDLPYGGSITLASMLPIVIISYRHGIRWGILTGSVFGVIQQLLGLSVLSYVTTWQSVIAVILLDYIIAFMVLGLGGMFKKAMPQHRALTLGVVFVCILRYACHVLSGVTVWKGVSIPFDAALVYSLGYNATYMIPETIVTAAAAYYIGSMLDFRNETIGYYRKEDKGPRSIYKWVAGLILVAMVVFDSVQIFAHLQKEKTGEFDFTGFSNVDWKLVAAVSVGSIVVSILLLIIASLKRKEKNRKNA